MRLNGSTVATQNSNRLSHSQQLQSIIIIISNVATSYHTTTETIANMAPAEIPEDKMNPLYADQPIPVKVHVLAPATLPAGYTFEASVNGDPSRMFTAEVVR